MDLLRHSPHAVIAVLLLVQVPTQAQTFQRLYGGADTDLAWDMARTPDGGYVLAGYTESFGAGTDDAYLMKTDSLGALVWTKTYGALGLDRIHRMAVTADSGLLLAGSTLNFGFGGYDLLLMRTNAAGDLLWSKVMGNTGNGGVGDLLVLDDGGSLICGTASGPGMTAHDVYLVRTDQGGDTLWTRRFGTIHSDVGRGVRRTADGNYVVFGFTTVNDPAGSDLMLLKVDDNGTLLTSRIYDSPVPVQADAIVVAADGGFLLAGFSWDIGGGIYRPYAMRTDAAGDTLWTGVYDTGGAFDARVFCAAETSDGGFIMGGEAMVMKVDAAGNVEWANALLNGAAPFHVACEVLANSGFVFCGYSDTGTGPGNLDAHLARTDASGMSGCNDLPVALVRAHGPTVVGNLALVDYSLQWESTAAPVAVGSGGTSTLLCLSTGTDEALANEGLNIAPNPGNGTFVLHLDAPTSLGNVEIFDPRGACVYRTVLQGMNDQRLELGDQPAGLYTVVVRSGATVLRSALMIVR